MRILTIGEMAEWSIAAVLKTVEGHTSGGPNPSLSAKKEVRNDFLFFRLFNHKTSGVSRIKGRYLALQKTMSILYGKK